jgi:hypothetical protein
MASKMEYALGLSLTATFTFLAIWINDTFPVGGELSDEDEGIHDFTPVKIGQVPQAPHHSVGPIAGPMAGPGPISAPR